MRDATATRPDSPHACSAPLGGVLEDPATGSANAALAALLTSLAPGENADLSYEILQGVEMGRPSQIIASARKTAEGPVLATLKEAACRSCVDRWSCSAYSTVTDFARLRGWSTSVPFSTAT